MTDLRNQEYKNDKKWAEYCKKLDEKFDSLVIQSLVDYGVVDGNTHRTIKAEIGNLYPGKTAEYVINLAGDNAREYDITLNFQGDDDGVLKDYVTVAIITENTVIEKPLGELLKGDTVALGGNTSVITLSYTMSESASNETQESDITFYIDLNAKRS